MATERLSMRKTREILRLKWVLGRSHRDVKRAVGVGIGTVTETLNRAQVARLDWTQAEQLTDEELQARLYPPAAPQKSRSLPDPKTLELELRRPGVTLRLLHIEYLERDPDGYGYTQFCEHYRAWRERQRPTMRQVHRAGDKMFVDYAGKRPHYVDPRTGERVEVELFVAVLGASNYTYVEASRSQRSPDWIESHTRAVEFFGGVTVVVVPDQLRSAVVQPGRYEPQVQRTYLEWARHYGTVVVPARPARPRDKAKVEVAVQIAERWVLARLRNQTFFSLEELNQRIDELGEELNGWVMRRYGKSRKQLFVELDQPALKPLATPRFSYGEWKHAKVSIDYHVELDFHYYSVPHGLLHESVEARLTATVVEIFHHGQRVVCHPRSYQRGHHTTTKEHMPKAHQKQAEWSPSRLIHWAGTIGPHVQQLVQAILSERPHPEQGYRSCLGIMRLGKLYGEPRLEAACRRALRVRARSYRHVESILKAGLDRAPEPEPEPGTQPSPPAVHENIRGRTYYH